MGNDVIMRDSIEFVGANPWLNCGTCGLERSRGNLSGRPNQLNFFLCVDIVTLMFPR